MATGKSDRVDSRRQMILTEVLAGNGHVQALSRSLGVSAATVRRDLQYLTDSGRAARTYGGAIAGPGPVELSLREKDARKQPQKKAIAQLAASLVQPGDTVILDAGTTVGRLADELRMFTDLTVITNGVSSIMTLAEADAVNLVVLAGQLRHVSQALIGPLAELVLATVTADKAFLGADGFTHHGVCCPTPAHSSLKSMMAARAAEVFVLADSSKLGCDPYHYWASLDDGFTLIADADAKDEDAATVSAAGGRLLVADSGTVNGTVAQDGASPWS